MRIYYFCQEGNTCVDIYETEFASQIKGLVKTHSFPADLLMPNFFCSFLRDKDNEATKLPFHY